MDTILTNEKELLAKGDRYLASILLAIKRKGPLGLFGAGDLGRRMKNLFEERGVRVAFFTDNDKNKQGKEIAGLPVFPPSEAAKHRGVFFVACSGDAPVIAEQLQQLGVPECDTEIYLACQVVFYSHAPFRRHRKELAELYSLLADEASRETLRRLVLYVYTLEWTHISAIQESPQYFFSDTFAIHEGETVVDAGAYTGDTVRDMVARFGAVFKAAHCFEPNRENFTRLREYVKHAGLGGKVVLHRLGLSDKKETLCFSGSGVAFHMDRKAGRTGEVVRTDTIDRLFSRRPVDFVKMDIEGAEPWALAGGAEVIRRDRPRLAICVYHAPEHLWTIPFFIKEIVPEYRLFLRHHSASTHEAVLYATL